MDHDLTRIGKCANCTDRLPSTSTIGALFDAVRSDRYAQPVRYIRHCFANDDDGAANEAKGRLPAAMPSGPFKFRANTGLIRYTGIVVADLDDVEELDDATKCVDSMPFVFGWFRSPSGTGLKVWIATDETDPAYHASAVATVSKVFAPTGLTPDPKCGDIARLCYVSHDTDAVLRRCTLLKSDRDAAPARVARQRCSVAVEAGDDSMAHATRSLETLEAVQGNGGERVTWDACNLGHDYGIPLEAWWPMVRMWNEHSCIPPWRENELRRKLESTYRNNNRPFGGMNILDGIL
jgi:hypothetical protein